MNKEVGIVIRSGVAHPLYDTQNFQCGSRFAVYCTVQCGWTPERYLVPVGNSRLQATGLWPVLSTTIFPLQRDIIIKERSANAKQRFVGSASREPTKKPDQIT